MSRIERIFFSQFVWQMTGSRNKRGKLRDHVICAEGKFCSESEISLRSFRFSRSPSIFQRTDNRSSFTISTFRLFQLGGFSQRVRFVWIISRRGKRKGNILALKRRMMSDEGKARIRGTSFSPWRDKSEKKKQTNKSCCWKWLDYLIFCLRFSFECRRRKVNNLKSASRPEGSIGNKWIDVDVSRN